MKAVIMAGGFGTRIQPLTIDLPKPMIPLVNRPIMLHIVDLLKKYGITELIFLLYHQPMIIKRFFGDGSEFGVRITYVTPLEDFGTAGAVKAAAKYLDDTFLIISGDLLTDFDLSRVIAFHRDKQALATITLTSVKDPLQFGVVITNKEGRINKFLEKPGWGEVFSDTINTGIYVLEPAVLDLIDDNANRDWSKDIFPRMLEEQAPLFGCTLSGYWADIGNTEAYIDASHDICAGRISVKIDEQASPGSQIYLGQEAQSRNARLDGMVVVGENSQIHDGAHLKDSIIGRNCSIEEGVELDGAILWDNVHLKKGCRVQGAVLCHNVRLGEEVSIEAGVIVGAETMIGAQALVKKDVKIWPRKEVEGGAIVTTNLIWGEKWRKSLFEGAMVRGLTNVELTPEFAAKLGAAYGSTLPKDSFILAGRDPIHASRMLKRSFLGGVLSSGVNVRDVKMISLPVLRYKLTTFGEVGGVHFRQAMDDPAVTEIIFYDADGVEISVNSAKAIERVFFKENFRRVHYTEPGAIHELPRIYDFYHEGFLRAVDHDLLRRAAPKVVIDLNHSPAGAVLPALLSELGCEVIELNAHMVEAYTGKTADQTERAIDQLSRIVVTLEATAGFWMGPSGERLRIVDETGFVLTELEALMTLVSLTCRAKKQGILVVPVAAPSAVELAAKGEGLKVKRVKEDGRALVEAAKEKQVCMAAALDGRIAFPVFQPNFDALFTVAKILEMLVRTGLKLGQLRRELSRRTYCRAQLPCSFDLKGGIMRKMSEDSVDLEVSFIDGVKVYFDDAWVLVLPDQYRSLVHIVAEADDAERAKRLLDDYCRKVEGWQQELRRD
ncbi:MAG: mannose-1-phosphate guanyltransferase [Desulfuromonadales bacterium]|nr:mannose-1-phosphate guanyltransferase [Desulfuromonadales bacterium]